MVLKVTAPVWSVGDITGHLSADRGTITGSESRNGDEFASRQRPRWPI
ncbi:hypothetical protein [Endozoicomonas acroporae]